MTKDRVVGKERKRKRERSRERAHVWERTWEWERKRGRERDRKTVVKIIFKYSYQKKKMCRASNYWRPYGTREIRKDAKHDSEEKERGRTTKNIYNIWLQVQITSTTERRCIDVWTKFGWPMTVFETIILRIKVCKIYWINASVLWYNVI